MRTMLELEPNQLLRAFHVNGIEIDGGNARDVVGTACNLFLLWQSEYPDYVPTLRIQGRPHQAAGLNQALFERTRHACPRAPNY